MTDAWQQHIPRVDHHSYGATILAIRQGRCMNAPISVFRLYHGTGFRLVRNLRREQVIGRDWRVVLDDPVARIVGFILTYLGTYSIESDSGYLQCKQDNVRRRVERRPDNSLRSSHVTVLQPHLVQARATRICGCIRVHPSLCDDHPLPHPLPLLCPLTLLLQARLSYSAAVNPRPARTWPMHRRKQGCQRRVAVQRLRKEWRSRNRSQPDSTRGIGSQAMAA